MKINYIIVGLAIFGAFFLVPLGRVQAIANPTAAPDKIAELKAQAAKDLNKFKFANLAEIIGQLVKFEVAFMGAFAFAFYLYAGILWMVAMGNSEQIEKAKNIFVWTTMGVGAALASVVLVRFLFHDVLKVI